jgi:hypothetical protein
MGHYNPFKSKLRDMRVDQLALNATLSLHPDHGKHSKMECRHGVLATAIRAFVFGILFSNVAIACKDRVLDGFFPVDELQNYASVYVVRVEKVVLTRPLSESWYTPPFTFEATVLRSIKGPKTPGALISGRTTSGEEPAARCPISLIAGQQYLLMLNRQDSPFLLPRYGSPYVSVDDQYFERYVRQIADFIAGR